MLLQTIKSRNLWLWGETVKPSEEQNMITEIKSNKLGLEQKKSKLIDDFKTYSETHENPDGITDAYQTDLTNINAEIQSLDDSLKDQNYDTTVNKVHYSREFTTPFKITALQSIDIQWDNPVGESYGIKTNFLQAWHNKPVNITFTGVSYFGAFGGETVGDLAEAIEDNRSSVTKSVERVTGAVGSVTGSITSGLSNAITAVQDGLNKDKLVSEVEGKYDIMVDNDIYKINDLMSRYGEGMFTSPVSSESSFWTHLLIENEKGADGAKNYAIFVGHIKHFSYKENVNKPFLYDFTCQFVGEPTQTQVIRQGNIEAQQDKNSLKLSLIASDSGYSLGYGF